MLTVRDTDGPPRLEVGNPGGVNLTHPATLHHGDDPRRATSYGDGVLERLVERRIAARRLPLAVAAARTEATAMIASASVARFMPSGLRRGSYVQCGGSQYVAQLARILDEGVVASIMRRLARWALASAGDWDGDRTTSRGFRRDPTHRQGATR